MDSKARFTTRLWCHVLGLSIPLNGFHFSVLRGGDSNSLSIPLNGFPRWGAGWAGWGWRPLSIPLNGFEIGESVYHAVALRKLFQFHWMDSWEEDWEALRCEPVHPFNSIEWILYAGAHSYRLFRPPAFQFHWMDSYDVKDVCHVIRVDILSIPLNGFQPHQLCLGSPGSESCPFNSIEWIQT